MPSSNGHTYCSRWILQKSALFHLLIFTLSILGACSRPLSHEPPYPIDSEIQITLIEDLTSEGRPVTLSLSTGSYSPHREIVASVIQSGTTFDINIHGLQEIDYEQKREELEEGYIIIIYPGEMSARTRVTLGVLESGEYHLNFNIFDGSISGTLPSNYYLRVTPEAYSLPDTSGKWIRFNHSIYRRVPEDIIWGYFNSHDKESEKVALSFLDSLRAVGSISILLPEGFYGYYLSKGTYVVSFQIDRSGQIDPWHHSNIPPFIFHFGDDPMLIEELIVYYVQHYGYYSERIRHWIPFLNLTLYTSSGHRFESFSYIHKR